MGFKQNQNQADQVSQWRVCQSRHWPVFCRASCLCSHSAGVSVRLISLRGPRGREGSEQERWLIRLRFAFLHACRNNFKALETGNVKLCLPDTSRKVENGQIKGTWCCGRAEVTAKSLCSVPPASASAASPGEQQANDLGITLKLKCFLLSLILIS